MLKKMNILNIILTQLIANNDVPFTLFEKKKQSELSDIVSEIHKNTSTNYACKDVILSSQAMKNRAKKLARFLSGRAPDFKGKMSHYWSMFNNCEAYSSRKSRQNNAGDMIVFSGNIGIPLVYEASAMMMMYVYEHDDTFVHVYHSTQRSLVDGVYVFGATFENVNAPFVTSCGEQSRGSNVVRFHYHKIARMNDDVSSVLTSLLTSNDQIKQHNQVSCQLFQDICRRYVQEGNYDSSIDNLDKDVFNMIDMIYI